MALTQQDKEEMYQYLVTRGKSLGSLDEGDSNLSNKYLAPVLEYSGGTAKVVRLAVSVLKGPKGDPGEKGKVGATPVIEMGEVVTVGPSEPANATFVENGIDQATGAKKYLLNLLLPKGAIGPEGDIGPIGATGPAPVLQFGKVTTLGPSEAASATFAENGTDQATGAKKYLLNLSIPKGMKGADGKGSGNVLVDAVELLAAKRYVFKPGQDGSANGSFVELGLASEASEGLMSKEDKVKLDGISGGDIEVSKENIEKVLTGNITTHTHDSGQVVTGFPVDVWDGVAVSATLSGAGTKEDPFLVQSCADYIHLYRTPNLYSNVVESELTEAAVQEGLANLKYIVFNANLDFNNHEIDFGDKIPSFAGGFPGAGFILSFALVDGQHCFLKNVNFKNTWSVFPCMVYGAVKNLHVQSGLFTVPANLLIEKGIGVGTDSQEGPQVPAHLFCLAAEMAEAEDVSAVCEIKITGDTGLGLKFSAGGAVLSDFRQLFPGFCAPSPSFFSNVKFSADEGATSPITIMYIPGVVSNSEGTSIEATGYDCTSAIMEEPAGVPNGLMVGMMIDGFSSDSYRLYVNADNALPLYIDSTITPFHTAKTTAEMKSPEFLALLNGGTGTFAADAEGVNSGYPVFKTNTTVRNYDGYVRESVFEDFKKTLPDVGGSLSAYYLPTEFYYLTKDSTSEEISAVLGGEEGYNKLLSAVLDKNSIVMIGTYGDGVATQTVPCSCFYIVGVIHVGVAFVDGTFTDYALTLTEGVFSLGTTVAKIPKVYQIPWDVTNLKTSSTSDEILTAWGGKSNMEDFAHYIGKDYLSASFCFWGEGSYHLAVPCLSVAGIWNSSSDFGVLLEFCSSESGKIKEITFSYSDGIANVSSYIEYKNLQSGDVTNLSSLSSFTTGYNTVTSLSSVPTSKQSVLANLSANTTLGLSGTLDNGKSISVKCLNAGSSQIMVTLLDSGKYVSKDNKGASVTSLTIPAGGMVEISLWALNDKYYVKTDA